jgi:hypothetical protein
MASANSSLRLVSPRRLTGLMLSTHRDASGVAAANAFAAFSTSSAKGAAMLNSLTLSEEESRVEIVNGAERISEYAEPEDGITHQPR